MWDEVLKLLHVNNLKKKKNENKTHRNAYGRSLMMKDEGFHLGFFLKSFISKGVTIPPNNYKLATSNDPCNWHFNVMCIKNHQCEQVKFHIIGAKGGIH
jgi:hypothetical protein